MALAFRAKPVPRSRTLPHLLLVGALAVSAALGMSRVGDLLPDISNPFASSRTVDRSAPAVLHALEDVAQFKAATANYSVVLDVEKDAEWLPSFVKGERTVFLAAGAVDATVDLSTLDAEAVSVSEDRRAVTLRLPGATLSDAVVDPERSRVVSRDRGVLDRVGSMFADNPTSERGLYLSAERKLEAAARTDATLLRRAEQNTQKMLEGLLVPLGFETVIIEFSAGR